MTHDEAVKAIVEILRPFRGEPVLYDDYAAVGDSDEAIRQVVRAALKELGVYDAYGCPLCLS